MIETHYLDLYTFFQNNFFLLFNFPIFSRTLILNLVGGTEPHKFDTCIHLTLRNWKNKICVVNFIYFYFCSSKSLTAEPLKLTR